MAATDKPYRNQYTLDVVFGVSSILLLIFHRTDARGGAGLFVLGEANNKL